MTEKEVVELMESSKSEEEWDANCDKVEKAFHGKLPTFWRSAIVDSGVYAEAVMWWSYAG